VVVGIKSLRFEDGTVLKVGEPCPGATTLKLYDALVSIQYGKAPDRHGWVREVCRTEAAHSAAS
jgi:hypothetical protein